MVRKTSSWGRRPRPLPNVHHGGMKDADAFKLATELLQTFIESQEIPPGGTSGTAASHGQKTGEFLAALHKALYDYLRQSG